MISTNRCKIFFDFDNTIARYDVFDDLVERFASDNNWVKLEQRWRKGQIGSKECLSGQLKCVKAPKGIIDKYLSQVSLDPYYSKIAAFLRTKRIKPVVLSDNFDYILRGILNSHSLNHVKLYCNKLRWVKGKIKLSFPFRDKKCKICAHCKKKNLLVNAESDSIIIYIGDGRSDTCPASYADIIFAKEDLLRYCQTKDIACIRFKGLKSVYQYLRRSIK
ncbi:MAG: MtnX-like HAD-IB family phosphatase [Candidatus Omnitrophota bacterium]